MPESRLSRPCPTCSTPSAEAPVFLAANLDPKRLSKFSYASRKVPEFMNYEFVRCLGCHLVYVREPPTRDELSRAYHAADYDSAEEATSAAEAYITSLRSVIAALPCKYAALEIGTGTGAFLELLEREGFAKLVGIEPSSAAIASAPARRREWIIEGVFEEQFFESESFDLVCCFMTMEHVLDPKMIADSSYSLLRPGGVFITVTHDYGSPVNRILGKRSPIIDIEHLQLFSKESATELFRRSGFLQVEVKAFRNRYALRYWWRLLPLPGWLSNFGTRCLSALRIDSVKLSANVGNIIAVGQKPLG